MADVQADQSASSRGNHYEWFGSPKTRTSELFSQDFLMFLGPRDGFEPNRISCLGHHGPWRHRLLQCGLHKQKRRLRRIGKRRGAGEGGGLLDLVRPLAVCSLGRVDPCSCLAPEDADEAAHSAVVSSITTVGVKRKVILAIRSAGCSEGAFGGRIPFLCTRQNQCVKTLGTTRRLWFSKCTLRRYFPPFGAELLICPSEKYVSTNLLTGLKNVVLVSR